MEYTAEQQQYQQQYQYQQQTSAPYDPSNYHQATAYYAYPNQPQFQYNHQQHQPQFQYYPSLDSYPQHYSQFYQDAAAPIHPPGVPLDPALRNHPTACYQPLPAAEPQQQQQVIPDSAAAPNFVGNINLVRGDNPPPQMQPAHKGGRRGARPFRAGSRGHVGNHGSRPDGCAPPHNKGRGPKGSRQLSSNGVTSAISNSILYPIGTAVVMPPSASVPGQATLPAQVPTASHWPPPHRAWCELCRVDCNRPEILEQHKNGKRHKKNLRAHEELQQKNKVITGQQSVEVPNSGSKVVQLEKVEGSEEKQHQLETLPPLAITDENKKETEHQKDMANNIEAATTDSVEGKRKLRDPSTARGHGLKRKRGGGGGRYIKSNEGPRRPVEPPKPKGGIPLMCELCNVKCESQVVFNSHLAGKKHIANLKRFHAHSALYGEAGLKALYPPNINAPSPSFIPQIQQGITDPQVVLAQLLTYVLSQAQVSGLAAPQIPLPAATSAPAHPPLSSSANHYPVKFIQGSSATSEVRSAETVKADAETCQQPNASKCEPSPLAENNKVESKTSESEKNEVSRQQYFTAEFEVPAPAETQPKDGALDSKTQAASSPMDKTISPTSEYLATGGNKLLSSTSETDARAECKIASSDPVDKGSSQNMDEPEDDPEEQNE